MEYAFLASTRTASVAVGSFMIDSKNPAAPWDAFCAALFDAVALSNAAFASERLLFAASAAACFVS